MATSTDCDFMIRVAGAPNAKQAFFDNPDGIANLFHLTPHDEHKIYDAVDFRKNTELRQDGKVVVVTGARGIGRAIAVEFAEAGAKAVAIGARTQSQLEETKRAIEAVSPETKVYVQHMDVTSDESVKSFFSAVKEQFGTIDTVVSNAGINNNRLPVAHTDTDAWWKDFEINVKGTYLVTKYFIQQLGDKTGTIVSISTSNAICAIPIQTAYASSKLAAARFMECVHFEAPNVRVFSLHPGIVETEMSNKHKDAVEAHRWSWINDTPQLPAAVSVYLASPRAEFLRGRWITVNWRVDELEAMKEEIVKGNLLKTAFNAKLGR